MGERNRMLLGERSDLFLIKELSLKNDFGAAIHYLYTHFFNHCRVTFPYMEILSLFVMFVQKILVSCLSNSFVQKTTQQSDGSCNVTSDCQLLNKFLKFSLFISANTYEKYIVIAKYCNFRHDDKLCFLPNCRYHIILIVNLKELLQKLDAFCFNYQHVHCLYTLFKYRFSGEMVVTSGQLFDNV